MLRRIRILALLLFLSTSGSAAVLRGVVVSVSDGDTITLLDTSRIQHRVRLVGVDAPERGQPWGKVAGRHLRNLIQGKSAEVDVRKIDRYGRIVGRVIAVGGDVSAAQLSAGMAWVYSDYLDELSAADRALYLAMQQEARSARRGLWADTAPVPPWQFRRQERRPSEASARAGTVVGGAIVGNRNSHIYHLPGCPDREKVAPSNVVIFGSEADAVAAGYRKARNCNG